MVEIEAVDVKNKSKAVEAPINIEVFEMNEAVNEVPKEEPTPTPIEEPKPKANAQPLEGSWTSRTRAVFSKDGIEKFETLTP